MSSQNGIMRVIKNEYNAVNPEGSMGDWMNYAKKTMGYTTFSDTDLQNIYQADKFGRGDIPQGSGSFDDLVKAEKDIAKSQFKPPAVTGQGTTGSIGGGYQYVGSDTLAEATNTVKPDAMKRYLVDKAMGKRGIKPEVELTQPMLNPNKAVQVGSDAIASQSTAYNTLRNIDNANLKEDINFVKQMGVDKLKAGLDDIVKGITDSPSAKAIIKVMNTPEGQTILKGAKIGGKAAGALMKLGMKAVPWVGWGMTGKDLIDLAAAGFRYSDAKKQLANEEKITADFENYKSQGIDPKAAWQMANGLSVESDEELAKLQQLKNTSDKEVSKQQALTDAAKASYEQALALQGNGGGGNDNVPPPTTPDMPTPDGEPSQPLTVPTLPKTTLDYTDLSGIGDYSLPVGQSGAMTGAAADFDPIADKFTQDILESNNVANQEQIMQQLQDNMQRTREVQARDPRYQGDILTPDNPYQVDPRQLRLAQAIQYVSTARQNPAGLADLVQQQAQQTYQQQLANQAGVPYEDYINATMEARANEITNLATERDNILKQQVAQATNMKEKIGYMQERYKLRQEYQKAMMENQLKGQYDLQKQLFANQGNLDVAQTNVAGDVAIQRMKEQDPSRLFGNYASFAEALAYTPEMYRGQILYNMPYSLKVAMGIQSLTPEQLAELFAGRPNQVMMPQNRPTFGAGFNQWLNPNKE